MTARKTLTLTIMGRDYRLAVAPDEEANLRACAELVQSKKFTNRVRFFRLIRLQCSPRCASLMKI